MVCQAWREGQVNKDSVKEEMGSRQNQLLLDLYHKGFSVCVGVCGGSENIMANRVSICMRQEGSLAQHDSVAGVGSNFKSLTLGSLF